MGRKPKNPAKAEEPKSEISSGAIGNFEEWTKAKEKEAAEKVATPSPSESSEEKKAEKPVKKRRSKAQKAAVEKMLKGRRKAWRDEKRDKKGRWADDGKPNKSDRRAKKSPKKSAPKVGESTDRKFFSNYEDWAKSKE